MLVEDVYRPVDKMNLLQRGVCWIAWRTPLRFLTGLFGASPYATVCFRYVPLSYTETARLRAEQQAHE